MRSSRSVPPGPLRGRGSLGARSMTSGLALCAALALTISGCFALPRSVPERTPQEAPAGLDEFYNQDVTWSPCESQSECATVMAPIDYADPGGGTTELAVIRRLAEGSDRVGSLLVNPGGPGASGYDFVASSVDFVIGDAVRSSFDIVGWDPRGVGRSDAVDCYDDEELDDYLYGVAENPVGSDAWLEERAERARGLAEACRAKTGKLLGYIDAASTARDMDLLRAVVGDERLNYLGFSYGTVFGARYAELFPEKTGRLVLDGAADPTLPPSTVFPVQMAGFESAYRAFLEYCLDVESCPFTGTVEDAAQQSEDLLAGVDARALASGDGRTLTSPTLGTALAYALYNQGSWDALAQLLGDLREGDPGLAFEFADSYYHRLPDGRYDGNTMEVYTAALCVDGVFSENLAGTRATLDAIDAAAPLIGRYLAYSDWVLVDTACQNWPAEPALAPAEVHAEGSAPILVLGTTNDPATPYAWAQSLAEQLENGTLVTRDGEGHTAYPGDNRCIDRVVDAFLVAGTVPETDPSC